ncbi:MAG: hypothetical protein ACKVQC_03005, partial [Elusimicrobiota bacterium]
MEFKELDRLFDESLARLEKDQLQVKDAYGGNPLASDHFMLKKSWAYFKERIQTLENYWKQILASKQIETDKLKEIVTRLNSDLEELREKGNLQDEFETSLTAARIKDLLELEKQSRKIKFSWEEERIHLEEELDKLRNELSQQDKKYQFELTQKDKSMSSLRETIYQLKEEAASFSEKINGINKGFLEKIETKDE